MKLRWIILLLVVALGAAFFLTANIWDASEDVTLALSAPSQATMEAIFYQPVGSMEQGGQLRDRLMESEDLASMEAEFRPVVNRPNGSFTVEVPTYGTTRFWGLWRQAHKAEYVLLAAKRKSGEWVFKCVSVHTTDAIDLD